MPVRILRVADADDARLDAFTRLTDVSLRRVKEPAEGIYIAESAGVIRRAVEAGHRPVAFLMAERWVDGLVDVFEATPGDEVPVYVGEPELLQAVTGFNVHRGALAAIERPMLASATELLDALPPDVPARIIVLEAIVDHTNVGAIFRSAAALGAAAVLVSPECADPLYRRSVRVSMGTVFQIPWTRLAEWPGGLDALRGRGFTVAALALDEQAVDLDQFAANAPRRVALILGAEGDGLSRAVKDAADLALRIPMMAGVDSLNVAAASAVALWALR